MEKAAHQLSEKIALHLQYDDEKKAVVEYGLLAVFNIIVIGFIISIIGLIFRFWYESVIIFLGVGLLKKSTGGAHAETMLGCTVISVLSITVFSAISRYILNMPVDIYISTSMTVFILIFCIIVFYRNVPVDTPNKPIHKPEKIKRLRRQSFAVLGLYAALSVGASLLASEWERLYSIAFCIRFILIWQTIMLTKSGQRLIKLIDLKI